MNTFIKVPLEKLIGCGQMFVNRTGKEVKFVTKLI